MDLNASIRVSRIIWGNYAYFCSIPEHTVVRKSKLAANWERVLFLLHLVSKEFSTQMMRNLFPMCRGKLSWGPPCW